MRLHLKLINKTAWATLDLRRFFLAGMKAKGVESRTITVTYGKWDAHHGFGWYSYPELQLSLPGPKSIARARREGRDPIKYLELAQVFEHEIDHTLGLKHRDMIDWWKLRPTWHEGITIEWTGPDPESFMPPPEPPPPEPVRYAKPPRRRRRHAGRRRHFNPPGAGPRFTPPGAGR